MASIVHLFKCMPLNLKSIRDGQSKSNAQNEFSPHKKEEKKQNFTNYSINVSDGDVVSEISKLARNAGIEAMVMGTSTGCAPCIGSECQYGSFRFDYG